jgi:hypothetical protein
VSTPARATSMASLSFALALVACPAITTAEEPPQSSVAAPSATVSPDAQDDSRREVHLDFVTEPMPRNASLAVAGTEAASRALELAAKPLLGGVLARRDGWGIASRTAWVLWVDMPLGSLGHTLNHEYGHLARLPDDATGRVSLRVSMPFLSFSGSGSTRISRSVTAREQLAFQSGGWEADQLALMRTRDMLYAGDRTHYVDALQYSVSKLSSTRYLLQGTQESRLHPQTEEDWHWDPLLYARWLSEIEEGPDYSRAAFQGRARSLRRGAYWNLVDYTLWASTVEWIKGYVVKGEHSLPAPWLRIGSIGFAPSLAFTLTPIGPERTVLTGLQLGPRSVDIHVRWTDTVEGRRLFGGGSVLRLGSGKLVQQITVDAWRDPSDTLGGRVEVGGEWRRSPDSRIDLRWSLGGKSRGYLTGFPDAPGMYATVGLRAVF